jgi:hypothetical protein
LDTRAGQSEENYAARAVKPGYHAVEVVGEVVVEHLDADLEQEMDLGGRSSTCELPILRPRAGTSTRVAYRETTVTGRSSTGR